MKVVGIIGTLDVTTYVTAMTAMSLGWVPKVLVMEDASFTDDVFAIHMFTRQGGNQEIDVYRPGWDIPDRTSYVDLTNLIEWRSLGLGFLDSGLDVPDFAYTMLQDETSSFSAFLFTGSRLDVCKGEFCELPASPYWVKQMDPPVGTVIASYRIGSLEDPFEQQRINDHLKLTQYITTKPPLQDLIEVLCPSKQGLCDCFSEVESTGHFKAIGHMAGWSPRGWTPELTVLPQHFGSVRTVRQTKEFLTNI